ncbi:MAG: alpha-galactosidase [Firmicutes bacterium]|uniref:Alpha-galactosidase n=1 Tax=Candidatus Scybalomonas excrementavium TaxID=2840943 RepID=A0A9D9I2S0_9FIRM|nr:alpha-galactosidase [Candidatus Scybalomonas excrementavium]
MGIVFDEQQNVFMLQTKSTTYAIGIVEGYLGHIYYGRRVDSRDIKYLLRYEENPKTPKVNQREKNSFLDQFPMEYPEHGMGDYREAALCIRSLGGYRASESLYQSHWIQKGKKPLEGLPASFGTERECETLCITCFDPILHMEVELYYTVFEEADVITRHVQVQNKGKEAFYIEKILSASMDFDDRDFELLSLHGSWARERHIQRTSIGYGRQNMGSIKGESSHQEHPFLAVLTKGANQEFGEVYSMNFVYSGNFIAQVEKDQFDRIRMSMGIHPEGFCWKLEVGERFIAPEVVLVYSDKGLGKMTRTYHDFYRNHLIRSPYKDKKRPILINNWEATYFDFHEQKLLEIAKEAKEVGIEMLVMDDGWFGKRNADDSSLGDWFVNEDKIKGGLKQLVDQVNALGLQFGIWFEPEMVSPDSDLFREHEDWAIQIPKREITQSRAQYVLDLSRKEVVDYVYEAVAKILRSTNIAYVKWDMNRQLTTLGSVALPADRQGELYHRYMLGVYELQERILQEFPKLLLENCSGGGARFDPGMLYYSPQIWCSDDTDAIERLLIQEGTALIYPVSTIGAHVSVCPNHIVGRNTPFQTRGNVALCGTFGYELDITKLSREEKELIKQQVVNYHTYNELIREGDYYRLISYSDNKYYDSYMFVNKEKTNALLFDTQILARPNRKSRNLRLQGLEATKMYMIEGKQYSGAVLMNVGILLPEEQGDFMSRVIQIKGV